MKSLRTKVAKIAIRAPVRDVRPSSSFARRVPLRPARIAFLHEQAQRDGRHPVVDQPWSDVRRWRGQVEAPPHEGWVPVLISEMPSGRTFSTELEHSLFEVGMISAEEGQGFELVRWFEPDGSNHLRLEQL